MCFGKLILFGVVVVLVIFIPDHGSKPYLPEFTRAHFSHRIGQAVKQFTSTQVAFIFARN
jgi:hypothetical protein